MARHPVDRRATRVATRAALVVACIAAPMRLARAQGAHDGHGGHDTNAATSAAGQYGSVAFANSGAAAAQPAFLRGLALLHNFQYPQAVKAFREAEQVDPHFAMAYWGDAMSYNHGIWREQDSVAARAALARLGPTPAARAAAAPTPREAAYLRALDVLYATTGTKAGRDSAYADTMAALAARYPDDVDAQLFHALALLSLVPRTDSTYLRAAAIAGRVLRDHPQHPGALHYVIHAYDDPAHAQLGLAAARGYSTVAVDAPHAQHMTSHIFIALGMWDDVVAANEHAIGMTGVAPGSPAALTASCGHAGLWLHYAYLQQGRLADARRMMDLCRDGGPTRVVANGYAQMLLRAVVDVEQPEPELASLPDGVWAGPPHVRFLLANAIALDALRRHDTTTAHAALARMRTAHDSLAATVRTVSVRPEDLAAMGIAESEVAALLALARGRPDTAVTLVRHAAAAQDVLPFAFGPPDIEKPTHELLADLLLTTGHAAEARHEYELALKQTPGRSATLLGSARAARAMGDTAAARASYKQLAANWHRADATVGALHEVRMAVGADSIAGAAPAAQQPQTDGPYKVLMRARVGGEGGTDYIYANSDDRRLYVARNRVRAVPATDSSPARDSVPGRVTVFDLETLKPLGEIMNGGGQGVAVDARLAHGFASSHPNITMLDTKSMQLIKSIDPNEGNPSANPQFSADGIYLDPSDERVYIGSHPTRNLIVLDAHDGAVLGKIDLGGVPEQTVSNGRGTLYAVLQDSAGGVAVVDEKAMKTTAHYPFGDVGRCNGLAIDAANNVLFAACSQGRAAGQSPQPVMVILSAVDGKIITTLPLAGGSDGAVFNPQTMEAFSSHGNGTLTVIKERSPTQFEVEENLQTMNGARTLTLDTKTGHIFVMSVERGPAPTPPPAGGRPSFGPPIPGSFTILMIGK